MSKEVPDSILSDGKTRWLPNIMEQRCPPQNRFRTNACDDYYGVIPDVFIMVGIVLVKAEHRRQFRDWYCQDIGKGTQNICNSLATEHFGQFNQNALRSDAFEQFLIPVDCGCRLLFDLHFIHGCERRARSILSPSS